MLSAANSTVGQTIIQLCKVLRLRCVVIVRAPEKTKTWLQELGASVVLGINAHIRVRPPKARSAHNLDSLSAQTFDQSVRSFGCVRLWAAPAGSWAHVGHPISGNLQLSAVN